MHGQKKQNYSDPMASFLNRIRNHILCVVDFKKRDFFFHLRSGTIN